MRLSIKPSLWMLGMVTVFPSDIWGNQFDSMTEFPPGKNRELVAAFCGSCHSNKLVLQHEMTREQWSETLDWMTEKQGMPNLPQKMRTNILDYLGAALAPKPRFDMDGIGPRLVNPLPKVD